MVEIVTQTQQADPIVEGKVASRLFQLFIDDLVQKLNASLFGAQVGLTSYTVATLPDVQPSKPGLIFVSDETGGSVPAFSDGTNWRRITDRAIVS